MVISLSKRRSRTSKKTEDSRKNLCSNLCKSVLYLIIIIILFFFFIYIWLSKISNNVFHICVFSKNLNDPYCLTAGSKPGFHHSLIKNDNFTKTSVSFSEDGEMGFEKIETFAGDSAGDGVSDDTKKNRSGDKKGYGVNLDSGFDKFEEMGYRKNKTFAGKPAGGGVSDDLSKSSGEDENGNFDKIGEVDFVKSITFTGKTVGDEVAGDPSKSSGEDEKGNFDKFGEKGSLKNKTFTGESAGDKVSDDPNKSSGDVEKRKLDKFGEKGFQKNKTFAGKPPGDEVPNDSSKNSIKNENFYDVLYQDLKSKDLDYNKFIKPKRKQQGFALEAIVKNLKLQRSWISPKNNKSCESKGVYVYNLPSKFNKDLTIDCKDIFQGVNLCSYFKNEGFGEKIKNLGQGWFNTHMYALEPILHSRVLKHPCRVYNEAQAKLFYVPYYAGFDVLRWHFKNVSNEVKDRMGFEVLKWLKPKESWRRNSGKDHVFVLGKISWDFRRKKVSWGSSFLELQEMQNPIKLLIERNPWHINDIAIPHPTYFHPNSDKDIAIWQTKIATKYRKNLVSFAGGARPGNPNNIRSILIKQCVSSSNYFCQFLNCTKRSCKNPENVLDLFQDSEFCLQPPGDSATRRSVFDSLISGCIPVIFNPLTAYYQYTWHLPEDYRRYSVYISEEDVREKRVNVVEKLMAKTLKEREALRSYIIYKLLPSLIYRDSNAKFEKFRDAFDITFDNLIEKINKLG